MAKETGESNRINKSTYDTEYPWNQVTVTRSGHEIHYDDTPGKERIRIAHKDGTYMEISPGGKTVSYNVGHHQQYNKGGVTITVDENNDLKISGHQRINVGGGSHISVAGDADVVVGGGMNTVVAGNMHAAVAGKAYLGIKGSADMNIDGDMNMKVGGSTTMETQGDHVIKAANIRLNP